MQRRHALIVPTLAVSAGMIASIVAMPAAQADPNADAFLDALTTAGIGSPDPANAVAVGQSVCPMLSEEGQTTADTAASVADATGMSLGPATMFTGIAVSIFCPAMMSSIGTGESPIPLSILGF